MQLRSKDVRAGALAFTVAAVVTMVPVPVAAQAQAPQPSQAPRTQAAARPGAGDRSADPRWSYERPDEETLQYATPDARLEPIPLQVQRLRRENQDFRAQIATLEERVRSLIMAVNTLTITLSTAPRR